ncbi:MAG: cytidine deaminase [Xanthomonadales bacterium]
MKPLPEIVAMLKIHAKNAAFQSYSPYSKFKVGAAVLGEEGEIFAGCNVENASYGLTQCAERNAISAAIAGGLRAGTLMSLVVYTPGEHVCPPCGACRQVMHEMMAEESQVISCCDGDIYKTWSRKEYLPDPFVAEISE